MRPRRYRVDAEQREDGPAASPARLVNLYLLHLEGGALSARGKPYSPKTIACYREGLAMLTRSAAALGLPDDLRMCSG
ncbi:MAG TPA: hypothetical protein VH916_11595 [Dehalococcoidia bacterium]